jgi:DNA-binding transcriptional LysR family regulator
MNLETLRIYCSVVRSQSFSRGAAMNNVSQSAASQAVHQLERHFGIQLIDRTKRPFVLTPEGEACYEGLRDILQQFDALEARVLSLRQEISGTVRVAAIYSIGLHEMSRRMQEFMSRYPKAKVRLEYLGPQRVYEAVLDEEADLGIVSYPQAGRGLTVIPLRSETMVLVCHPDHHLARLKRVTLSQLRGENFVGFDKNLPIRKELDRYLRDNQVAVRMVVEFDNIETIKQAVEIGAGLSILPEPTVEKEVKIGTLAAVPIAIHKLRRPIGIIHRQRKAFTPTISKFVDLLKEAHGGPDEEDQQLMTPSLPSEAP